MSHYVTLDELRNLEGATLDPTEWIDIGQQRIDQFAECTQAAAKGGF